MISRSRVEFIKSAVSIDGFIRDPLPRAVLAGRSNVGKSSMLNRLFGRKSLARVSSQPGKTSQVNYFLADERLYIVDLPGYGFAKVSKAERDRWARLMEDFFSIPEEISLGVLLVDIRHRPTGDDVTMARYFMESGLRFFVAACKADSVSKTAGAASVGVIRKTLGISEDIPVVPFSAKTGEGADGVWSEILRGTGLLQ